MGSPVGLEEGVGREIGPGRYPEEIGMVFMETLEEVCCALLTLGDEKDAESRVFEVSSRGCGVIVKGVAGIER